MRFTAKEIAQRWADRMKEDNTTLEHLFEVNFTSDKPLKAKYEAMIMLAYQTKDRVMLDKVLAAFIERLNK